MGKYKIQQSVFYKLSAIYLIISIISLPLTSGGWTMFIEGILGIIFFAILGVILISKMMVLKSRGFKNIVIYKPLLNITLTLQSFLLLFNFGDCGDNGGGYVFIEWFFLGLGRDFLGYCQKINNIHYFGISRTDFLEYFFQLDTYLLLVVAVLLLVTVLSIKGEDKP